MVPILILVLGYFIGLEERLYTPAPVWALQKFSYSLTLFLISDFILQEGFLHRVMVGKMATGSLHVASS